MPEPIELPGSGVLGVIPARFHSSRFPGKVIHPLHGKPMVQHVWEAARRSKFLTHLCIATEDERVESVVRGLGAECHLTPAELPSGTDRVAWVSRARSEEIVINLQADEPLLEAEAIDLLITGLAGTPKADMATLAVRKPVDREFESPHVVKVVSDLSGRALYFSRQALASSETHYFKHIGIYAYRRPTLLDLCGLPPSPLERQEKLEQLRALEHGYSILVVEVGSDTVAVDVPEDVKRVEQKMQALNCANEGLR